MRRRALPALVVLALVAVIVVEVLTASGGGEPRPAPPLPPAALQPPKTTLAALRGRPALVNFWASWCDPCRKEAPQLERFYRSLHGAGALVGVDYNDGSGAARAFIHRYGWTFPVLSDPSGSYGARYELTGLPTTVVLDARGRIVETLRGPQTATSLHTALEAAS